MATNTPIHALSERFQYTTVAEYPGKTIKDGFLAVASLIGSAVILIRAYQTALGFADSLPKTLAEVVSNTTGFESLRSFSNTAAKVTNCEVVSVLYTPSLKSAAVDLESRFVEAALGPLHSADLRNFGHGRHHWIAKRGDETGILALIGDDMSKLADQTLDALPSSIERVRIDLQGAPPLQALMGLITGLYFSEAAGRTAGIDPGKPGVPPFGRKLYRIGPGRVRKKQSELNLEIALKRKAPRRDLHDQARQSKWETAYHSAVSRLAKASIKGIAFDYDGTLCDGRSRFDPLTQNVSEAIIKLLDLGLKVGIATGRGPSAGVALRAALPATYWKEVLLGYYNGGVLTSLADERDPIAEMLGEDELFEALKDDTVFSESDLRANSAQITIRLDSNVSQETAIAAARRIVDLTEANATVVASSHSVDIVRSGASKLSVVQGMVSILGDDSAEILCIGDKGAWPGNDALFLDHPLGLTVDIASTHVDHCWHLAPAGIRGVQATLYYLSTLRMSGTGARLIIGSSDRGVKT